MRTTRTASHRRITGRLIVLATVPLLALTACGAGETAGSGNASGTSGGGGASVYALVSGTNVPYLATYAEAMTTAAEKAGVQLTVLSADFDASKQAQQFDQAIAASPDAIIVAAVDATAVVPSLLKASQADIPVVASNTGVDESGTQYIAGFTGPDDVAQGADSADLMGKALNGTGAIAIVEGALGTTAQINRSKGFTDQLTSEYPGISVLDQQPGAWDKEQARSVAADFITRFGGQLTGIFAEDDTMASGVAQAIADAGRTGQIQVVGLGGSTQGFAGITDGSIYGTVIQSPVGDGELAVKAAAAVAAGDEIPATQYLDPVIVTADNVGDFTAEW